MTQKNRIFRRILAISITALLGCSCYGCGSDNTAEESTTSTGQNVAMEDLDYGSTMREDDDVYAVPLYYDKRYLEEEELTVLANYFLAIQNQDVSLLEEVTLDFYMESLYENAYGGLLDDSAYVTQQYSRFQELVDTEEDIQFSMITVDNVLYQEDAGSEIDYVVEMFNELNDDDSFCDTHMQSFKTLSVVPTVTDGTTTSDGSEMPIYIINLDGTYYVCA